MDERKGVKRKLDVKSMDIKYRAVMEVERGLKSKAKIAEEFGVKRNTLSTWIKNKQTIIDGYRSGSFNVDRKKMRHAQFEDIEDDLYKWFVNARSHNVPVSGPLLQAQAEIIAKKLGYNDFKCSGGWLDRFQKRYQIVFKKISGEAKSVNLDSVHDWYNSVFLDILDQYDAKDIYNADETAIFYKLLPDRTLTFKGDDGHGTKTSKERLSVLVAANMNGTDKRRLLVIGKSAKPRCFKNVATLPTQYESNKKAWMTSAIFTTWVHEFDEDMARQGRQVALLIDNCPAHPDVRGLRATTLFFLPPNTTSVTQPMDQGVILSFKRNYRKQLVDRLSQCIDSDKAFAVSVLDALHLMKSAWDLVSHETIANCFMHVVTTSLPPSRPTLPSVPQDYTTPMDSAMFEEYVSVDMDAVCTEDINDENEHPADEQPESSTNETEQNRELRPTSAIIDNLERLRFDASTFRDAEGAFDRINWLMNWFEAQRHQRATQTTIKDFFVPKE